MLYPEQHISILVLVVAKSIHWLGQETKHCDNCKTENKFVFVLKVL